MRQLLLPLSVLSLAAALMWSGIPSATADDGPAPAPQCKQFQNLASSANRAQWMGSQLEAGRSRFVAMAHKGGGTWLCAW